MNILYINLNILGKMTVELWHKCVQDGYIHSYFGVPCSFFGAGQAKDATASVATLWRRPTGFFASQGNDGVGR